MSMMELRPVTAAKPAGSAARRMRAMRASSVVQDIAAVDEAGACTGAMVVAGWALMAD